MWTFRCWQQIARNKYVPRDVRAADRERAACEYARQNYNSYTNGAGIMTVYVRDRDGRVYRYNMACQHTVLVSVRAMEAIGNGMSSTSDELGME